MKNNAISIIVIVLGAILGGFFVYFDAQKKHSTPKCIDLNVARLRDCVINKIADDIESCFSPNVISDFKNCKKQD